MVKLDLKHNYSIVNSASTFLFLYILFAMSLSGRHAEFLMFQQNCLRSIDELDLKTELHNKKTKYGRFVY